MIRCRHTEAIHLVLIADDLSFFLESVTNSETILQISLSMIWIGTVTWTSVHANNKYNTNSKEM